MERLVFLINKKKLTMSNAILGMAALSFILAFCELAEMINITPGSLAFSGVLFLVTYLVIPKEK